MMEDALQGILLSCLMALITNGIAYKLGFFKLPSFFRPHLELSHLLSVFGIYFGFTIVLPLFLPPLLFQIFSQPILSPKVVMFVQFLIIFSMLITLFLYMWTEKSGVFKSALKRPDSPTSRFYDFGLGLLVWVIAIPWVTIVNQLSDSFLYMFFHFENYEQVAVRYLRDNLSSSSQMLIALLSVVVIAPIVEEIMFRGTLQQYLKKFFSVRTSILITSIIFACFHFSSTQSLGNVSLIASLFVFACFLGYTYERQGSIFASIGLHLGFNLASSLQILFFQA